MAGAAISTLTPVVAERRSSAYAVNRGTQEGPVVRWTLTAAALLFLTLFIVLPAANVFYQAFSHGAGAYWAVFFPAKADAAAHLTRLERRAFDRAAAEAAGNWSSIRMTFGVAAVAVPLNVAFGLAAAWAIGKFRFRGRNLLISLIDLPFSVSPVVAGLIFVLLFGRTGLLGDWANNFRWPDPTSLHWRGFSGHWWPMFFSEYYVGIIFTPLAIVLASIFVTFPFVARTLVPLMESQGIDEELAAISLGASGRQTFFRVTMPNIKWGLLYGVVLCTARALGEFGAVSVVSGHTDDNNTMPLRINLLWENSHNQAAFTLASVLTLLAVFTLLAKTLIEWGARRDRKPPSAGARDANGG